MENISRIVRSLNETQRICTHDISGHLHLLRFCIDELLEQYGNENNLLQKVEEGISKLEDMNKVWKVSTRFHDPHQDASLNAISEKAFGIARLYYQKFIPNIDYVCSGACFVDSIRATIIVEAIFAAVSIACNKCIDGGVKNLGFDLKCLHSNLNEHVDIVIRSDIKITDEEISKILSHGDENEKTLRRYNAFKCITDLGGSIEFNTESQYYSVRIKL